MMERLRGSAETTIDEKGRFKVPAVFREPIDLIVMVKAEGMRLDHYVVIHVADFSRTDIQKSIAAGGITVNGKPSKPGYKVRKHDKLHVEMPEPTHDITDLATPSRRASVKALSRGSGVG